MRDYRRSDPAFSLCGLCCALCPMHRMEKGCPGCGGGEGHQSCAVIRCALAHGWPESCALCPGYPCPRLTEAARFDSFVPHRNQLEHLNRWAAAPEDFRAELAEKSRLLTALLEGDAKALLLRLIDAENEIGSTLALECFIQGFRLGMKLAVEGLDEAEGVDGA